MKFGRASILFAMFLACAVGALANENGALPAQVDPAQIEVTLVPDQAEICLGEPLHLTFLVKNNSDRNLRLSVGGDYQNGLGRPDSFTLVVKNEAGAIVPKREAPENMGGIGFHAKVPALGSYRFRLFVPHWAIIKEPGVYEITAKRVLNFYTEADEKFGGFPVEARTHVKVAPEDREKLGQVIAAREAKIMAPRQEAREEWTELLEMTDERVIPILSKSLEKDDYSVKFQALSGLAKFNTDEALEGLKTGMAVDQVGNATTPELRRQLAGNIRHCAAVSLSKSPHPGAFPFLLEQRHDPYSAVRMTVLHAIAEKLDATQALPLLQEMSADEEPRVAREAQRYLKRNAAP